MTIWLLALVLLASLAGLGYRQGAIRMAFSFLGILLGALLAPGLGHLLTRPLMAIGISNPVVVPVVGPLLVFFAISLLFKGGGLIVHRKVELHFKYHANDIKQILWERLNRRLGLCLGPANALVYLVLISWMIYAPGYWTVQTASDTDPRTIRILTRLAQDLQSSGLIKVARAVDRLPPLYYDSADLTGLLYRNPKCREQLEKYPAFMGLVERPEIHDLLSDKEFQDLWAKQAPMLDLIHYPKVQALLDNPEQRAVIQDAVVADMADLRTFLETGQSPKYASWTLVGHWNLDVPAALTFLLRSKPNITSSEMQRLKGAVWPAFAKTTLFATTDHKVAIKSLPPLEAIAGGAPVAGSQVFQGDWKNPDGKYQLSLSSTGKNLELTGAVEGDRLTLKGAAMDLAFDRAD